MRPIRITLSAALLAALVAVTPAPTASLAQAASPTSVELPASAGPLAQAAPVPPSYPMPPRPIGPIEITGNVIIVTGQGSVDATPDEAMVALGFQVIRPTAQEAQDLSSTTMDRILRQVMAIGIPREKIRTATASLWPVRRPGPGSPEITGYQATNRIVVTVDDLPLTGRIVDTAVAAGANSLDSLTFGLRDPSASRMRALRIAVERARTTATAIAAAAGVSNIHLVRIEEVGPMIYPRVGVGVTAPAVQADTQVMPGTLTVTVQVRAVYGF